MQLPSTFPASMLNILAPSTNDSSVKNVSSDDKDNIQLQLIAFEKRFETYVDKCFMQLQDHIDDRFNRLEERLIRVEKSICQ
jgi:hypothetical protein